MIPIYSSGNIQIVREEKGTRSTAFVMPISSSNRGKDQCFRYPDLSKTPRERETSGRGRWAVGGEISRAKGECADEARGPSQCDKDRSIYIFMASLP